MAEQKLMAENAVARLNLMNFLLEDDIDFGFNVRQMPHQNDQTWQRMTVRSYDPHFRVSLYFKMNQ